MTKLAPLLFGQPFSPFAVPVNAAAFLDVTNVQKLGLPPATAVGTVVHVSDGFVVSGAGINDGFFFNSGFLTKRVYTKPGFDSLSASNAVRWTSHHDINLDDDVPAWVIYDENTTAFAYSYSDTDDPWQATNWKDDATEELLDPQPTLTHPAVQVLAAPSASQGGVAVLGGTLDGIYTKNGTLNGKDYFNLLGVQDNPTAQAVGWTANFNVQFSIGPSAAAFYIIGSDNAVYYSLSDVATPNLATNWKNASDDTPAGITVTSVSQGDLVAGNKLGSVIRAVNSSTNGRNKFSDVLGSATDLTWDGTKWTDGTTNGSTNVVFPDIGTVDPVAAEENWDNV